MRSNFRESIQSVLLGNKGNFFYHFLTPLWILSFYFVSVSSFLPGGVNNIFIRDSGIYVVLVTSILSIIFIVVYGGKKGSLYLPKEQRNEISPRNVILLLFPLMPIAQYILNSSDILSFFEAIYVFLFFTIFAAIFILFIPMFFAKVSSPIALMLLGVAFTFSIMNMGVLSKQFSWYAVGNINVQVAVFLGVFIFVLMLFSSGYPNVLYVLVVILFVTNSVFQILKRSEVVPEIVDRKDDSELVALIGSRKPEFQPNIYLLVYDAYVVNETMLSYGIDNRSQEQYLKEIGFQIYPQTYSIGSPSVSSMSRVLNASTQFYGNPRRAVSGDGVVHNLLNQFGYKNYGLFFSDYFFRGTSPLYDYSFPTATPLIDILIKSIFIGEFRFDVGFDYVSREEFDKEKYNVFSNKFDFPKFIYMHSLIPGHSQNSGKCLQNEIELFEERLLYANAEMKRDISIILKNDPNAIVIVAGDHGPYLTKNCLYLSDNCDISEITRLDIQDRFGTFLAIRWPTQDFEEYDDITILQDLFPSISAYLFQDATLLNAKVETITLENIISGAKVVDGIIEGGINDGEPLFIGANE